MKDIAELSHEREVTVKYIKEEVEKVHSDDFGYVE